MMDEMWMMRPQRRWRICGTRARVSAMIELRFSSTMRSQTSSVMASMGCGWLVPALLMRMSTRPICSRAARARRSASSRRAGGAVGDDVPAAPAGAREDLVEGAAQLVLVAAGDDDVGAGLGQAAGHGLAQALAAAGH